MEFSVQKSVTTGMFRFTLSETGINISAPIIGLRLGAGPSSNRIHIGRGNFHYRDVVGLGSAQMPVPQGIVSPAGLHTPALREIESGKVSSMVDSSSEKLLEQINHNRSKFVFAPLVAIIGLGAAYLSYPRIGPAWNLPLVFVAFLLTRLWDTQRKTTVLMYDFEAEDEVRFKDVYTSLRHLGKAHKLWHVKAAGAVGSRDKKYQAGAGVLVGRDEIAISFETPKFIATNVPVIRVPVGRQSLYFLPNAILISDGSSLGGIAYGLLNLDIQETNFIESDGVPGDAKVVGSTWRYVNKSGGPDRRFKDNPSLSIARYEEIHFRSASELNELLQISRVGLGASLANTLQQFASARSNVETSPRTPLLPRERFTLFALATSVVVGLGLIAWLNRPVPAPTAQPPRTEVSRVPAKSSSPTIPPVMATKPAVTTSEPAQPEQIEPVKVEPPLSLVERKIKSLRITALVGGTRARAMIDGTLYSVGDTVDRAVGILVHSIDSEKAVVTFIDLEGKLYARSLR